MKTELDSLAPAIYVKTDDLLKDSPHLAPWRPAVGIAPQLADAELVTLAVMQAMLGFTSKARWLRHARSHLRHLFPYLPKQPGYNKHLRKAAELLRRVTRLLATDTSVWSDHVWIVDSTPVECGRSRETVKHSDLAGWAEYGHCASHSRFFWGLRLHLVCTLQGLPITFALTGAKADERETLLDLLAAEPHLVAARPGQTLIGDKNYFGPEFEHQLAEQSIRLLRPARKGEPERPGAPLFKPLRQVIESVNETFKGQLDLEQHRGRTPGGVIARVMQRIHALTAAIWHNDHTGQPLRSLTAYDLRSLTPWNRSSRAVADQPAPTSDAVEAGPLFCVMRGLRSVVTHSPPRRGYPRAGPRRRSAPRYIGWPRRASREWHRIARAEGACACCSGNGWRGWRPEPDKRRSPDMSVWTVAHRCPRQRSS
ncbi:hypothetical protein QFZ66_001713 [Streptomyces sp. B4I13]|nr:hypothetical protein [Streptomyces sp. B4I13]